MSVRTSKTKSLAGGVALSMLFSIIALAVPLTVANANHGTCVLDVAPETDSNPTGATHTLTATLRPQGTDPNNANATGTCTDRQGPVNVDFEATFATGARTPVSGTTGNAIDAADTSSLPDLSCSIQPNESSCTVSYTSNSGDIDTIRGFVDEGANNLTGDDDPTAQDTVAKIWVAAANQEIDCGPESDTNPVGQAHTVTCTVREAGGGNLEDAEVDFQVTGANPTGPANGCVTGAAGTCSFNYTGNSAGTDTIQAFVDQDATDTDNDCGAEGTGDTEFDDFCDQMTKTYQARTGTLLNVEPETDTNPNGTAHELTVTVRDQFGQAVQGETVDFEIVAGPNDNQTGGGADFTCAAVTDAAGQCTATYTDDAAFAANNATDTICGWIDSNDNNAFSLGGGDADGGDCDAETANETETGTGPNTGNDETDTVLKTWTAASQQPATTVNAVPENDTNPVGTSHVIGVFTGTTATQATTGSPIRADILPGSANASQQTAQAEIVCAVDPNPGTNRGTLEAGQTETHECAYTGANTGTDTIRVFADLNGNNIFEQGEPFDDVTKIWHGPVFAVALSDGDTATAGVCNEFTVRVTDVQGNPVVGQTVDVEQTLQGAGTEPGETRELSFCNPANATGPNPTGQGGTSFGDVGGNNQPQTAGQAGRNTTVHAEVGPTNINGEVTFGINITQTSQTSTVSVRAWFETDNDDVFEAGEATDQPSTKTWTPGGAGAVTGLDALPETATNPVGTTHAVTVTLTGAGGPIQGVTPNSVIATNPAGRPSGDVADPNAGTSPNAAPGSFTAYTCTESNAQGVSTCTFTDQAPLTTGTDTIVFYVNQLGGTTAGPDTGEPQDAVQKTWTPGPTGLILDLQCAGTGTDDDGDVAEQGGDNAANADCTNPTSDQDEVFTALVTNAGGIGQQNVRVDFTFGSRTNGNASGANNSTNDATLNASPGGQVGTTPAGLQTFCLTDATGRCSVTLTNATPQAGDTIAVNGAISGQTVGGTPADTATKQWLAGVVFQGGTMTLTPRAATNQIGTQHTVTATVLNQFGQPVQGANVDFRITQGPNAGLAQTGMTDAVTNAQGQATFVYTSNAVGTDTIVACSETGGSENDNCNPGEPTATATKTWQTGPVTTALVNLDMQARTQDAGGADTATNDCEVTTANNAIREKTATNQVNPNVATGAGGASNFHEICAAAYQTGATTPTAGAQITFTISGVGRVFAVGANERCSTAAVPAAGTTLTVTAGGDGVARACLFSQQVGRTTVTASSGTPAQSDTGTKDWTGNPSSARFIQLCHGDAVGTTCATANQTNEPDDNHQMTARVTDRQGNPVANVPVQFTETGPAIFIPQGGNTATVLTDANGLASVLMTSTVEGSSTVVAEISPVGTVGGFRGAGAADDECEQPAGTNNQPAAGNCVSSTLTKIWDEEDPTPQCDDGIDNDGDGFVDFDDDPSCVDENDDSEAPFDEPDPVDPTKTRHERRISMRFTDGTGKNDNGLVVYGRLRLAGDATFVPCIQQQPVNIQRRIGDRWVTKKTTNTNRRGRYAVEIFDQVSRYRAVAPRTKIEDVQANHTDVCRKAVKAKRHRHR